MRFSKKTLRLSRLVPSSILAAKNQKLILFWWYRGSIQYFINQKTADPSSFSLPPAVYDRIEYVILKASRDDKTKRARIHSINE